MFFCNHGNKQFQCSFCEDVYFSEISSTIDKMVFEYIFSVLREMENISFEILVLYVLPKNVIARLIIDIYYYAVNNFTDLLQYTVEGGTKHLQ